MTFVALYLVPEELSGLLLEPPHLAAGLSSQSFDHSCVQVNQARCISPGASASQSAKTMSCVAQV